MQHNYYAHRMTVAARKAFCRLMRQIALWGSLFLLLPAGLQAEGVQDVAPNPDDMVMLLVGDNNYGNFANFNGPEYSRLYVNFQNPGEQLFIGLSREYTNAGVPQTTGNYSFQIKRADNGFVTHGPFSVTNFSENVSSWADASGPADLNGGVGYSTDDDRFLFTPDEPGLYYIEFIGARYIGYWDFTVGHNGVEKPGRVYSKNWAFRTPTEENVQPECVWDRDFNGTLYSYTVDGFVTRINFAESGFQGLSFNVAFNRRGPGQTGDLELDRMSIPGTNTSGVTAEHLIFLQEPDPLLYPDGECGDIVTADFFECLGEGDFCLEVSVTYPGQAQIILDFNQNGVFDPDLDQILIHIFEEGDPLTQCVEWDGLMANGEPPLAGAQVGLLIEYQQGIQHWALFDGEFLKNGFCVESVRPVCNPAAETNLLFWDDRNIPEDPGNDSPKDGRQGCDCNTDDCRTWTYFDPNQENCNIINDNITLGYGDKSTLNTWWYASISRDTLTNISLVNVMIEGEEVICDGFSTDLTLVWTSSSELANITWNGPNGTIATGPSAPQTITVDQEGIYEVIVTDENGCTFTNFFDLVVENCPVDLELDIEADQTFVDIGETVTFTVTVVNAGDIDANGVAVTSFLPAGITNVGSITGGGVLQGNTIVWDDLVLDIGQVLEFTFTAEATPAFDYTVLAEITACNQDDIDSTPGNGVDTDGDGDCSDDPDDEDDGDCVELEVPACTISATTSTPLCDDAATPSDPSDDTFTFELTVTGGSGSETWVATGDASATGAYGATLTLGPFPIAGGDLDIDIADSFFGAGCSTGLTVEAPPTCSDRCDIELEIGAITCQDNGTASLATDDTYTVEIRVTGLNTAGSGWSSNIGVSGAYDEWITIGPFPISSGDLDLLITDDDDVHCAVTTVVPTPPACSDECEITVILGDPVCHDNGTPSDASDDTFTVEATVTGLNVSGGWQANDPLNTSGGYGGTTTLGPYAIADGDLSFTIQDNTDGTCIAPITLIAPPTCSDRCAIELEIGEILCDDSGTSSDGSDDTFTVEVRVTGFNLAEGGWTSNTGHSGAYNEWVILGPFDIADGDFELEITDLVDDNCVASAPITAPPHCSTDCAISVSTAEPVCDDNGTPTDPSDDTFTVAITVSGANNGPVWLANDPLNSTGSYDQTIVLGPYPIAAGDLNFDVFDAGSTECLATVQVVAPETCSDQCGITVQVGEVTCSDNGTSSFEFDDQFFVEVTLIGANASATWQASNGQGGLYGESTILGPFPIAQGNAIITFNDAEIEGCTATISVDAPPTCSPDCEIVSTSVSDVVCSDNGTPADPSDDTFTFLLTVSGYNTAGTWVASTGETGNYDEPTLFGPYSVFSDDIYLTVADADEPDCAAAALVQPPASCSDQCAIDAEVSNIVCDDNNTPADPSDDVFFFDIMVTDLNNGGPTWITSDGTAGFYGDTYTIGPFPIAAGPVTMDIRDIIDPACTTTVEVLPPEPCSDNCILVPNVISVDCSTEDTDFESEDDTFFYTIEVDVINGTGSWTASDGTTGNYGETVMSTDHPYNAGTATITITDDAGLCETTITVDPPSPEIMCPPDINSQDVEGSIQVLQGVLTEDDSTFTDVPCFLALNSTPMTIGDRYFDAIRILTPDGPQTPDTPNLYVFYLFTKIALPGEYQPGVADGTGDLFRGNFDDMDDPCCFNLSFPEYQIVQEGELGIPEPFFDTSGIFQEEMFLVKKFTHNLKANHEYTLMTTTYGVENIGEYAWVVVSGNDEELQLLDDEGGETTSTFFPDETLDYDLTHFDIDWVLDNPETVDLFGGPNIDPLCGIDSLYFTDYLGFENDCEVATITRVFTIEYGDQVDSCEQVIFFQRPTYDDIILPPATAIFECGEDYLETEEGWPHPIESGYPVVGTFNEVDTLFENQPFFNLATSYKDIPTPDTTGLFTAVTREWTIIDLCNGDTILLVPQLIKIGNFGIPNIICPLNTHYCPIVDDDIMLFNTDPFICTATVEIPLPELTGDCANIDEFQILTEIMVEVPPDTIVIDTILPDDDRILYDVEIGDYLVRYTAFNSTGDSVSVICRFRVADLQEPVALCQGTLTVEIDEDGVVQIFTDDINLDSYDNCGEVTLELRRIYQFDPTTCDTLPEPTLSDWGPFVEVNCCDVGLDVTVEMRVTDPAGNTNVCWLYVGVEDTSVPVFTELTDLNLECWDMPIGLDPTDTLQLQALFGAPTVSDNCQAYFWELEPLVNWDYCQSGTILRRFNTIDVHGNTLAEPFEQLITIGFENRYGIGFPKDTETDCVDEVDVLTILNPGCAQLEVSQEDVYLAVEGEECYYLERTYHIINQCTYDGISAPVVVSRDENCDGTAGEEAVWVLIEPEGAYIDQDNDAGNATPLGGTKGTACDGSSNPSGYWRQATDSGYWIYTQRIKIFDNAAPVITFAAPDPFCTDDLACEAPVSIPVTIAEYCLPENTEVQLWLDAGADGVVDTELNIEEVLIGDWPEFTLTGEYPIGSYAFALSVTDGCGNPASAVIPFTVYDCYVEDPAGITGLIYNLEELPPDTDVDGDGEADEAAVVVSADELATVAFADCSEPLRFSLNRIGEQPNMNKTSIALTCDDRYQVELEVYVWDDADNPFSEQPDGSMGGRNYKMTTVLVYVQDPELVCNSCIEEDLLINGVIYSVQGDPINEVTVDLRENGLLTTQKITGPDGEYEFVNLNFAQHYEVKPFKNDDTNNGLSTLDLILLAQHLLGDNVITDPYALVGGDVNRSGTITTLDILQLQMVLLGNEPQFPENTSWRFIPSDYQLPPDLDSLPDDIPDSRIYENLLFCQFEQDFIGIKIGDLNGTATPDGGLTDDELDSRSPWPIYLADSRLVEGGLQRIPVRAGDVRALRGLQFGLSFSTEVMEVMEIEPGLIEANQLSTARLDEGLLTALWMNTSEVQADDVLFTLIVKAKADARISDVIDLSDRILRPEAYDVQLQTYGLELHFEQQATEMILLANRPDPFREETQLEFFLPVAGEAVLEIHDATGRSLQTQRAYFPAGTHILTLEGDDLPTGVLSYTLTYNGKRLSRRMVKL